MALAPAEAFGKIKLVAFASTVLLPMLLVQLLALWRKLGLGVDRIRPAPLFLVSRLAGVVVLAMGGHPQENRGFGGELVMQFVNAFGEELLFRGVIFALRLTLSRWQAIVLSGVCSAACTESAASWTATGGMWPGGRCRAPWPA